MFRPAHLSNALRLAALCCLVLLLGATGAQAQAGTGHLEVFAGLYSPDNDFVDDEVTFGIRTGYQFNDSWSYNLQGGIYTSDDLDTIDDVSEEDFELYLLDLSFVWHSRVGNYEGFNVFFGPGYAFSSVDGSGTDLEFADDSFTLHAGLGWNIMLGDNFSIRPDVRARYFDAGENTDLEATIALGWVFE